MFYYFVFEVTIEGHMQRAVPRLLDKPVVAKLLIGGL